MAWACKDCGSTDKGGYKDLCDRCYYHNKPDVQCKACKEFKKHKAHGLCGACYLKAKPKVECKGCKKLRSHRAHGLCNACYSKVLKRKQIICESCKELRPHCAHGLCRVCYNREYPVVKKCVECKELGIHVAHGLCKSCYGKLRYIKMGGRGHRRKLDMLIEEQGFICNLQITHECKKRNGDLSELERSKIHVDHIWPVSRSDEYDGDINETSNLQAVCSQCNMFKHDKITWS